MHSSGKPHSKPTEHTERQLIIIRGPSGSGKSTLAQGLAKFLGEGTAIIPQDTVRRDILSEHDLPGGSAPEVMRVLVDTLSRARFDVILEGMLRTATSSSMLAGVREAANLHVLQLFLVISEDIAWQRHSQRPWSSAVPRKTFQQWFHDYNGEATADESRIDAAASPADVLIEAVRILGLEPRLDSPPNSVTRLRTA